MSDPQHMRRLGRLGGLALHAHQDSSLIAARARRGLLAKFERQVDPDARLHPRERRRRALLARRAHMQRLSLKAAAKRRMARYK